MISPPIHGMEQLMEIISFGLTLEVYWNYSVRFKTNLREANKLNFVQHKIFTETGRKADQIQRQ